MTFSKKLLISILLIFVLFSVSAVSAQENVTDGATDVVSQSVEVENNELIATSELDEIPADTSADEIITNDSGEDEGYVIYVGQNKTEDGGNGSYENPYGTFEKVCNDSNGRDKVTIKIFDGVYTIAQDKLYNFNVSNLKIEGLGNNVIINAPLSFNSIAATGFKVNVDYANVTINNINFNSSSNRQGFSPLRGTSTSATGTSTVNCIYNNCTFSNIRFFNPQGTICNVKYVGCEFNNIYNYFQNAYKAAGGYSELVNASFDDCRILNFVGKSFISKYFIYKSNNTPVIPIIIKNCWFGSNKIPSFLTIGRSYVAYWETGARAVETKIVPVSYAIFSATENYLGNNTYEIVGKLTWNGTDSQEGMENFQPMTVKLSSNTGNISETAVLKDGTFRAIYTSNSPNNYVSATLDNEEVELEFTNIDMLLDAPAINVGEDQNITITLPQNMTANVTLVVNNKTYLVEFNNTDSVTYTIEDILGEGNYTVEATLDKDGIYAKNSTVLSVSKVTDYEFNVITPSDVVYGDVAVLIIELPDDATGNVTVVINNKKYTAAANKTVSIPVDNLVAGDNEVETTFGDFKYAEQIKNDIITVEKATATITAEDVTVNNNNCKSYSVIIKDSNGNAIANETVIIKINNESKEATTNDEGVATVDLDLAMGIYPVEVTFDNPNYELATQNATISVVYETSITVVSLDGETLVLTAVLKDINGKPIANETVSYTLNGENITNITTDENGEFAIQADDNTVIAMTFEGTDYALSSNATITLKNIRPKQISTQIIADNPFTRTAVDYKAGERGYMFYFYLKDENGKALPDKKVKIGIDGKIYTVTTDKDGKAGQMINMANENSYTYALSFLGDEDYKASFAVSRLIVVKKAVTITPAKTSYSFKTSAKTKTITATLKSTNSYIPKGKQVTLTIAGKTFKATIGDKGQISLNIGSITAKGTYKVAIKFSGTVTYATATSKTITVKIA